MVKFGGRVRRVLRTWEAPAATWLHLPRPGDDDPRQGAGQQGPTAVPAPSAPCCPRLPLAAAPGTRLARPISAEKRGLETFSPQGPGASPPSYCGVGREGAREVRAAGQEDGCGEGLQAAPCTRCHAPARLSFTLVAFIRSCSCSRRDKGAVGRRIPGFRSTWYRVTLESALPKSRNARKH